MASRDWSVRHRFYLETQLQAGATCRLDELARQLATVLRLTAGDAIILFNGDGYEYLARLHKVAPKEVSAHIVDRRPTHTDPYLRLTLFQCTLKLDKFEWVLQKGTELGVSRFVPVVSRRSVVRPAAALHAKQARWSAIIREATEQCGRTRLPELAAAVEWSALRLPPSIHGLVAWEEADDAPSLGEAAAQLVSAGERRAVALLVGPEGGLTSDEIAELAERGWQIVTMGSRILRAETAALAGVTILMERGGELAGTSV